jgi:hypothetical protein
MLFIQSSNNYSLKISNDTVHLAIIIQNCKNLKFDIEKTAFKYPTPIHIDNCSLASFRFDPDSSSRASYTFSNDTISNYFSNYYWNITDSTPVKSNTKTNVTDTFHFDQCYIDAAFGIWPNANKCDFIFTNCSFGPNANLGNLSITGIRMLNCTFSNTAIPFSMSPSYETNISIMNTDFENLRLNFTPNMRLVFDSSDNRDVINNTYQRLLSKFRNEGRPESYKVVDLQYRKWNDNRFFIS